MQATPALVLAERRPVVVKGLGLEGWRPFTIAAIAAGVASVVFALWTYNRWVSDDVTVGVDDIGEAVAALIATGSCGYAAWRNSGRVRVAWALFGASALSWGLGEVIWSWNEVVRGQTLPFPSIADLGFLVAIPLAVLGVFAFTSAPRRLATRGETVLAGSIVALSLLFMAWTVGLAQVYATSGSTLGAQLIGLAYPLGDIVTATVLIVALRRARRGEIGPMVLVLGG